MAPRKPDNDPRRTGGRDSRRLPGRPGMSGGGSVLLGLLLLSRGRRDALRCFEPTRDAFLAALAPWIAFLLVGTALAMSHHPTAVNLLLSLLSLCALLLPPVLTELLARRWKRQDRWLRFATASVWSGWLIMVAYMPALLVMALLLHAGVAQKLAVGVVVTLLGAYWFWLHWFLARHGLEVGRARALLVALLVAGSSAGLLALAEVLPPYRDPPGAASPAAGPPPSPAPLKPPTA
ncbi:hypothetical protein [Rhizosaccharibacter radicis]|uniref:Yip1 domain-containing protein n=1 Tax=Rhizosaccharibacter radicis TaxID=2782605 RepID=A0ABT1VVB8_9PROT|nr:hypothetical protein [Acetobacteraceae bacterium KSS12]